MSSKTISIFKNKWQNDYKNTHDKISNTNWDEEFVAARNILFSVAMILISFYIVMHILKGNESKVSMVIVFLLDTVTRLIGEIIQFTSIYFFLPFILYVLINLFISKEMLRQLLGFFVLLIGIFYFMPNLNLNTENLIEAAKSTLPNNIKDVGPVSFLKILFEYAKHPSNIFQLLKNTVNETASMVFQVMAKYFIWSSQIIVIAFTNLPKYYGIFLCALFSFILTSLIAIVCAAISFIPIAGHSLSEIIKQVGNYAVIIYIFGYLVLVSGLIKGIGNLSVQFIKKQLMAKETEQVNLEPSTSSSAQPAYAQYDGSEEGVGYSADTPGKREEQPIPNENLDSGQNGPSTIRFFNKKVFYGALVLAGVLAVWFVFLHLSFTSKVNDIKGRMRESYELLARYELGAFVERTDEIIAEITSNKKIIKALSKDFNNLVDLNQWAKDPILQLVSVKIRLEPGLKDMKYDIDGSLPDPQVELYDSENNNNLFESDPGRIDQLETIEEEVSRKVILPISHLKICLVDCDLTMDDKVGELDIVDGEFVLKNAKCIEDRLYETFQIENQEGVALGWVTLAFEKIF